VKLKYPDAQLEFEDWFSTEEKCEEYLAKVRWPEGFRCSKCGHDEAWTQSRGRRCCQRCRHQTTLTAGTLFEGTHLELRIWFRAIWWVVNQKHGVSAAGLQKGLGIGSYRTAWLVLHKIRSAMAVPTRRPLSGQIEVDEAWVGGKKRGLNGRNRKAGPMIVVAVEVPDSSSELGRIRMKHIPSNDGVRIAEFVQDNIAPGSHLFTDLWPSYRKLDQSGYEVTQTPLPASKRASTSSRTSTSSSPF
jgi:hypothetical protein